MISLKTFKTFLNFSPTLHDRDAERRLSRVLEHATVNKCAGMLLSPKDGGHSRFVAQIPDDVISDVTKVLSPSFYLFPLAGNLDWGQVFVDTVQNRRTALPASTV